MIRIHGFIFTSDPHPLPLPRGEREGVRGESRICLLALSRQNMIDLHAHILHNLDDGPDTLEESLEMCRIAHRDGIRTIVATPHTLNGVYETNWETVLSRVRELNEALKHFEIDFELRTSNTELQMRDSELRTPNLSSFPVLMSISALRYCRFMRRVVLARSMTREST